MNATSCDVFAGVLSARSGPIAADFDSGHVQTVSVDSTACVHCSPFAAIKGQIITYDGYTEHTDIVNLLSDSTRDHAICPQRPPLQLVFPRYCP